MRGPQDTCNREGGCAMNTTTHAARAMTTDAAHAKHPTTPPHVVPSRPCHRGGWTRRVALE